MVTQTERGYLEVKVSKMAVVAVLSLSLLSAACTSTPQQTATKPADTQQAPAAAPASKYPEKPLEFVAASGAGSGLDITARTVEKVLREEKLVTQPMMVVTKSGGGQSVGLTYLWDKKGDAYTLNVHSASMLLVSLNGTTKLSYKDVTPLAQILTEYQVAAVSADSKYKTIQDLMAALKADPKSVKLGGGGAPGALDHLAFLKPAKAAGVDVKSIPYVVFQGGGEALTALLGGKVDVISTGVGEAAEQVRAGKIRVLAVTGPKRVDVLKDVPTYKEAGIDAEVVSYRGFFGAPNMPADAKQFWETTFDKMLKTKAWQDEAAKNGWGVEYLNSADFAKRMEADTKDYEGLLAELGLLKK